MNPKVLYILSSVGSRVDALIERLSVELTSEAQRRGAWGLLGQYSGAVMINRNGDAVGREALLNSDGSIRDEALVTLDEKTGLMMPNGAELSMLMPDGVTTIDIPPGYFIHPVTARVLPIEGMFSLQTLRLFFQ